MVLLLQASCPAHCCHAAQSTQTPLGEKNMQLSFFEFLQRCGVPIAPLQPSQLPVPISLLDAAVQATPPCDAFQDVSTQIFDQQVSSLSFDVAVQKFSNSIHT